jgi:hypothetical protein
VFPEVFEQREDTEAESLDDFEQRLYELYVDNSDKYFARPRIPIIKANIAKRLADTESRIRVLDMDARSEFHNDNPDYCKAFGRPCRYLGLCSGRSFEDDGTWTTDPNVHKELNLPSDVKHDKVITNSRLAVFRGCELKHHRQYNQGLVKIKEGIEESLYIGQGGHVALEAYWKQIKENQ